MLKVSRSCFYYERKALINFSSVISRKRELIKSIIQPTAIQKRFSEFPHFLAKKTSHLKMETDIPKVVFVLGGPGAGKGTQCSKIVGRYPFVHLSAGDLLREERTREGSEYGALIDDYIRNGRIVPVEVTCSLIETAIKKSGQKKFLIDGFPRNQDNLEGWNRQMAGKIDLQFVLFFDCGEDICIERCLTRGRSSGRTDDNMDSLKKRIQTYNNDSLPIIKHFEELGQVEKIDASANADQVFQKVEKIFSAHGF